MRAAGEHTAASMPRHPAARRSRCVNAWTLRETRNRRSATGIAG
jgi:hypothetical protein